MKDKLLRCGWGALSAPVPGTGIVAGLIFLILVVLAIRAGGVVNPPYNVSVGDWLK